MKRKARESRRWYKRPRDSFELGKIISVRGAGTARHMQKHHRFRVRVTHRWWIHLILGVVALEGSSMEVLHGLGILRAY
jgi:hypothetical protein